MDKCSSNLTIGKDLLNLRAMEETIKHRTEFSFIESNGLQYLGKIKRRHQVRKIVATYSFLNP